MKEENLCIKNRLYTIFIHRLGYVVGDVVVSHNREQPRGSRDAIMGLWLLSDTVASFRQQETPKPVQKQGNILYYYKTLLPGE